MKVLLNQAETTINDNTSLLELLETQNIKPEGIAIAINNRIATRTSWQSTTLCEGDKITIIQATYGG